MRLIDLADQIRTDEKERPDGIFRLGSGYYFWQGEELRGPFLTWSDAATERGS